MEHSPQLKSKNVDEENGDLQINLDKDEKFVLPSGKEIEQENILLGQGLGGRVSVVQLDRAREAIDMVMGVWNR